MKKSKNVLLLGADTSLGGFFLKVIKRLGHHGCWMSGVGGNTAAQFKAILNEKGAPKKFDWVVNCYGRNQLDKIGETPYCDGRRHGAGFTNSLLVDNVMPIYWLINELVRRGHPPARVLNVASQTYRVAQTNTAIYCASKAALVQLSRTMARELAPDGWVINCLAPGKIADTKMAKLTDLQVRVLRKWTAKEADAYAIRGIPMRRFTTRKEVCEAMLKILDLPAYINGTCIDMTGGA